MRAFVRFPLLILLLAALFVAGCSLTRPPLSREYYILDAKRSGEKEAAHQGMVLALSRVKVAPPYSNTELVYRKSEFGYESDFYNLWQVTPAGQITDQTRQWLQQSGAAGEVLNDGSLARATHILEGNVINLSGDYRDPSKPVAVMIVQFTLVKRVSPRNFSVVFTQRFEERIPLKDRTVPTLIAGMNTAFTRILESLESDIRDADIPLDSPKK